MWRRVDLVNVGLHKIYTASHPRRRHYSLLRKVTVDDSKERTVFEGSPFRISSGTRAILIEVFMVILSISREHQNSTFK
jgi:hypothetical protein